MKPTVAESQFRRYQLRRKLNAQTIQQTKFDAETERIVKEIRRAKNKTK
jgi:hypothetical protein